MKTIFKKLPASGFVFLVCLLSILPYSLMFADGTKESPWTLVLMWIPAISAIIIRFVTGDQIFRGFGWNILRYGGWIMLFALIPLFVDSLSTGISLLLGFGEWNTSLIQYSQSGISIKKTALLFGAGEQSPVFFCINFLVSYWAGSLVYMVVFALGEEYGWRGYLQDKLIQRFGTTKGLLIVGIIWGYWHLPGVLFLGLNYPEYPILGGFLLMPVMMILFSFIFGVLYLRFRSIWIPAIIHGALNVSAGFANKLLIAETKNTLAVDITWSCVWLMVSLLIVFCFRRYSLTDNQFLTVNKVPEGV